MAINGDINFGDPENQFNSTGWVTPFEMGEGGSLEPPLALGPLELDGVLEPGNLTRASLTLPHFGAAAGDDLRLLPAFTLDAFCYVGEVGAGDLELPALAASGGTDLCLLPLFTLDADGNAGVLVTGAVQLPSLTAAGALDPALPLPALAVDATGTAGTLGSGAVQLPDFAVAAVFGAQTAITLPLLLLDASGISGSVAQGNAVLPALAAAGAAYQDNTADGALTLAVYFSAGVLVASNLIDAAVTLPQPTLVATLATGNRAQGELALPLLLLAAHGYADGFGAGAVSLPAYLLAAVLDADAAPGAPTRSTIALNTRLRALTLYDGLHANSYARLHGVTLAATADGIVSLDGPDDLGVPISAYLSGGISDLGSAQMKTVLGAYVGLRAAGTLEMTVTVDQHQACVYALVPSQAAPNLHTARVKFGRGLQGSYWQWQLASRNGADFMLDRIGLAVLPQQRRL